ncbi:hypothetical protein N0Y54_24915 [Nostoc punctiforme UO1]|uniref:hypothetical protein n=1 Tax=Nostoc punctiforme TaxID=272131 RepID=UPI0030A48A26
MLDQTITPDLLVQTITPDLLVELSIEEQQVISGGMYGGYYRGSYCGRPYFRYSCW